MRHGAASVLSHPFILINICLLLLHHLLSLLFHLL